MTYQYFVTDIDFSSYFFTGLVTHTSLLSNKVWYFPLTILRDYRHTAF